LGAQRAKEISCREVWREISNYLDDEVTPDLRQRMAEHFRVCRHCTAVLDGARNTLVLMADGQSFELPPETSQKLYRRLKNHLDEG
jgi:hypothetical protein